LSPTPPPFFPAHSPPPLPRQFVLADAQVQPNFQWTGAVLISGALFADAFVGNTQESLFAFGATQLGAWLPVLAGVG
jgi:hypothetical protein